MGNVKVYIKDRKIVALKVTIFYKVSKLMRHNNLNLFLKLLDYFVQALPHTVGIFVYYAACRKPPQSCFKQNRKAMLDTGRRFPNKTC